MVEHKQKKYSVNKDALHKLKDGLKQKNKKSISSEHTSNHEEIKNTNENTHNNSTSLLSKAFNYIKELFSPNKNTNNNEKSITKNTHEAPQKLKKNIKSEINSSNRNGTINENEKIKPKKDNLGKSTQKIKTDQNNKTKKINQETKPEQETPKESSSKFSEMIKKTRPSANNDADTFSEKFAQKPSETKPKKNKNTKENLEELKKKLEANKQSSNAANVAKNRLDCFFLVRGKGPEGEAVWHYVLVQKTLRSKFLSAIKTGQLDVKDYGQVVSSGWGEPSDADKEEALKKLERIDHVEDKNDTD